MENNIVIKELPEVLVASIRKKVENYEDLNEIFPEIVSSIREENLTRATPNYCFIMYHDCEYKDIDLDIEVCEAVSELKKGKGKLKYKKFDKVEKAATLFHKGAHEKLPELYSKIMDWIEENGYVAVGLPRESHVSGIKNEINSDNWITEIQIPIKEKAN